MGLFSRLLTKNRTEIPLFFVTFNYKKYKENGEIASCDSHVHPIVSNDTHIKQTLNELIDYIRDTYDMNQIP